jgi:adenosine deaminase
MASTLPVILIPKVELHRHLEGSVRFDTAWAWAQRSPTLSALTRDELRARVQFDGNPGYGQFLKKFETLRQLYYDRAAIEQVMREAVEDAALDNVRYLELRLSPDHFAAQAQFDLYDTAQLLFRTGQEAAREHGIDVRYLCTITRAYSAATCERIFEIALASREAGVVGFDLAGDETLETGAHVRSLLQRAHLEGMGVSVHAGETGSAQRVWEAIDALFADRIAHGIASIKDARLLAALRERDILLEVCPTSNLHTAAASSAESHPLGALVRAGVSVAIGTDDPSISRVTLSDEFAFATDLMGITQSALPGLVMNAARAAFLPEPERNRLAARLTAENEALHRSIQRSSEPSD